MNLFPRKKKEKPVFLVVVILSAVIVMVSASFTFQPPGPLYTPSGEFAGDCICPDLAPPSIPPNTAYTYYKDTKTKCSGTYPACGTCKLTRTYYLASNGQVITSDTTTANCIPVPPPSRTIS